MLKMWQSKREPKCDQTNSKMATFRQKCRQIEKKQLNKQHVLCSRLTNYDEDLTKNGLIAVQKHKTN